MLSLSLYLCFQIIYIPLNPLTVLLTVATLPAFVLYVCFFSAHLCCLIYTYLSTHKSPTFDHCRTPQGTKKRPSPTSFWLPANFLIYQVSIDPICLLLLDKEYYSKNNCMSSSRGAKSLNQTGHRTKGLNLYMAGWSFEERSYCIN